MMDKSAVEQYRNRWQAVTAVAQREKQTRPVAKRWQQLNAIIGLAAALEIRPTPTNDQKAAIYQRWNRLREYYLLEQSRRS